ncbi:PREDICTED: serine-rich adhesin for platelets isoform X4 [Drosophila arizonae]|uniref:Serine-rich adhesin for platelets isoform X4 n=1 Tax=Drosophila arizonae TaxID=7263 RepID=A0ABM1PHN1_DROAR|nr:PREDICTED: serine-rich adhesin for platelets isoform X4 [Drosophila arizonae]
MELPVHRGNNNLFLGLTSVVGLIGGAYLLQCGAKHLLSKLVTKKPKKSIPSEEQSSCNVCCAELDLSSAKNYVTCCTCGKQVCRGIKCANWLPKAAQWVCELCHSSKQSLEQTSSWVAEQMSFNQQKFVYPLRARSEIYIPISSELADSSMQFESVSQVGMNSTMNADERSRIREYVEEIVAEMLGGNLDHIKVGQLSKSENYLQLFDKFHAKLSNMFINVENALCARAYKGDLPAIVNGHNNNNKSSNSNSNNNNNDQLADISQTRLRTLIESIIAETLRSGSNSLMTPTGAVSEISLDTRSNGQLSGFHNNNNNNNKRRHRTEHYFEPKIYQDLLATAVLNKIADKEGNTRLISESTPDLSARNIDENYNAEALSTTSDSSIEPRSDCSLTDHELGLNTGKSEKIAGLQLDLERESVLSDYIAAHMVPLPDFSASVTESEDDIMSMTSSMVGDGTWEDNWLFKKKRSTLQSSATPSSIGMLVPAPKENIRAQIGDRTADEVSDLSEIGSDAEETSLDLLRCDTELNDRLLSKHLIGGQNTKLVLDELVDRTSLTSNTLPAENEPAFTETTNPLVQQPTKTSKLLVPPPPTSFQDDEEEETEDPGQKLIAGSIAEREVKKWYNAVEMPNNPYAPEALKQRISGTQERFMDVPNISPSTEKKALALMTNAASSTEQEPAKEDYKRYSRDYYINNAPLATTPTRGTSLACSSSSNRSTEPTDEDIVINEAHKTSQKTGEQPQERLQQEQEDTVPDTSSDNKSIYTAVPAQVLEAGSLDSQSNQSVLTTSDDSDTVRVYDFNKQETTVIKTSTSTTTSSMESALGGAATTNTSSSSAAADVDANSNSNSNSNSIDASRKRERPVVLQFGPADSTPNVCCSPTVTPTRGSTPPAFRFLQPKRRLIEPSQVLSIDDDEMPEVKASPSEKPAVEDDVVHALPSVKALAQAFLLTSKRTQPERRWRAKTLQHQARLMKSAPDTPVTPEKPGTPQSRRQMLQHTVSMAEVADESTIASDLSSLETDPSMHSDGLPSAIPIASPASPVPVRRGFLRSNIAFFENLKFK